MRRRQLLQAGALAVPALAVASAPARATTAKVVTGAEQLARDGWTRLRGKRFGVLTNPTGVLVDQTHVVDSMVAAGRRPTAVFGPEHGFRGTAQAGGSEGDYADPRTGVG